DTEHQIENLINELEHTINLMEDPDIWALFDDETQNSLKPWIEKTRNTIAHERDEIAHAREFLAKYGQ
ncbi:MAG: hypothetical protein NC548_45815, partial [Lachnospiraceae bacterium]|nr:hypothetical protein [Lachnospiraceae bacterium]